MNRKGALVNILGGTVLFMASLVSYATQETKDMMEPSVFNLLTGMLGIIGLTSITYNSWKYGRAEPLDFPEEMPQEITDIPPAHSPSLARYLPQNRVTIHLQR